MAGNIYLFPFYLSADNSDEANLQFLAFILGFTDQGYIIKSYRKPMIDTNPEITEEYLDHILKGEVHTLELNKWKLQNQNVQLDLSLNEHIKLINIYRNQNGATIAKTISREKLLIKLLRKGEFYDPEINFHVINVLSPESLKNQFNLVVLGVIPDHQTSSLLPQNSKGIIYIFESSKIDFSGSSIGLGNIFEISSHEDIHAYAQTFLQKNKGSWAFCYSLTESIDKDTVDQIVLALNMKFRPQNSIPEEGLYRSKYQYNMICISLSYHTCDKCWILKDDKLGQLQELRDTFLWIPQRANV